MIIPVTNIFNFNRFKNAFLRAPGTKADKIKTATIFALNYMQDVSIVWKTNEQYKVKLYFQWRLFPILLIFSVEPLSHPTYKTIFCLFPPSHDW